MKKFLAAILMTSSMSLSAVQLTSDLDLSGGYRQDQLHNGYDYTAEVESIENAFFSNRTTAKNVNIWQVGLKGRFVMPNWNDCCDGNGGFLDNFYVKGHAYWGWQTGGAYYLDKFVGEEAYPGIDAPSFGKVDDYETHDYQIGLGYLFDLSCFCDWDLGLALIGGYSWNKQEYKNGRSSSIFFSSTCEECDEQSAVSPDDSFRGKLSDRWEGGWIGTELFYQTCNGPLWNLGYEYHFADFRARQRLDYGYSDKRHKNNACGNVVYLDATYATCDGWEFGLGGKWSRFTVDHGKISAIDPNLPDAPSFNANATWQSWQVTANLGYNF